MKTFIGYLAEARIPGTFGDVWLRLGLSTSREDAVELTSAPNADYATILETRVTPYFRVSREEVVVDRESVVVPKQPVRRPKLVASALTAAC